VQPTAKSLTLDLLSSLRGQAMPVRALVGAGALFGISAESIRVALVRLCSSGTIERNEPGQYRLTAAAQPVQEHVSGWTKTEERTVPWRGGWIGVHTARLERSDRTRLRRRDRALQFLGFAALEPHLFVRPDNLRGGVDAVRSQLQRLGVEPAALVFAIAQLDPEADARARRLWDGQALGRDYRELTTVLARSAARLDGLPLREAMVESFILGGKAIRQMAIDPLLPEPIAPVGERAALIEALRGYDRLGRSYWRTFMKSHGAPHLQTPRAAIAAPRPQGTQIGAIS
jgi:phenylacetic acid degradation operon negative regulatory protein